ncbi:MAG: hypothetical protein V1725_04000 [archaeon]
MKFSPKRVRKKGSLELSVNAIVVLVMAIAVLGLGLAFIRGLIQKGQEKFDTIISGTELENPARADRPYIVQTEVAIKKGGFEKILGSVYNTGSAPMTVTPSFEGCIGLADTDIMVTTGTDLPVPEGQAIGFRAGVNVAAGVTAGQYTCIFNINDTTDTATPAVLYQTGQFFVNVKQ